MHCQKSGESMAMLRLIADFTFLEALTLVPGTFCPEVTSTKPSLYPRERLPLGLANTMNSQITTITIRIGNEVNSKGS